MNSNDIDNDRPEDLINYEDAAFIARRSKVTIRRWLRDGFFEKFHGKASHPNRTPPTLISRAELEEFLMSIDEVPRKLEARQHLKRQHLKKADRRALLIDQSLLMLAELRQLDTADEQVTGDAAEWMDRAIEAEAKLDESRRQVDLLLGEVACLRDALARRLTKA